MSTGRVAGDERPSCIWAGHDQPRVLRRRHLADCEDVAGCRGCQPCPEDHCASCGREHAASVCAGCLADARTSLGEIARMCGLLLEEAIHKGIDSEAAMLAGPTADPEAWSHRKRSAVADRIDARWLDEADEALHPLFVLGTWETMWRELCGQAPDDDEPLTIASAVAWLDRHLSDLAAMPDADFGTFRSEVEACRAHVETVLRDGEQVERGTRCPMCGEADLVLAYGMTPEGDRWCCPRRGCNAAYTDHDYRAKVEAVYVLHADRLTASQIQATYRIKAGTLRQWANRGLVAKRGVDRQGRQLYDVAQALATRDRQCA